jgi:hypothetical protein
MLRTPSLFALAVLTGCGALGIAASAAQAGDHNRSGYSSRDHDRGYSRHVDRERRGHVRNRWARNPWLKFARRGHGHGRNW